MVTRRTLRRRIAAVLLLVACAILLALWSALPASIPARGQFHDFDLETTVDSTAAKYYIESYARGSIDDPGLHRAIVDLKREFGRRIPTAGDLRRIAHAQSVDFAALFFADQLLSLDRNAAVNGRFSVHLDRVRRGERNLVDPDGVVIVLVPGYDYEENGRATGADLAAQIEILGSLEFQVEFVAVDPIGTVLESAEVVEQAIERLHGERIILAGPSSAGPAIHTALSRLGRARLAQPRRYSARGAAARLV